jgi:PAS domain S-box-containing protein
MERVVRLRHYVIGAAVVWTVVLGVFIGYEIFDEFRRGEIFALVRADSEALRDRAWITTMGGSILVPVRERSLADSLHPVFPLDTVKTPDGRAHIRLSPAQLALLFGAATSGSGGGQMRLVSNFPRDRRNLPDTWEAAALSRAGRSGKDVIEFLTHEGTPVVRRFVPLDMDAGCRLCHVMPADTAAHFRAGISMILPPGEYYEGVRNHLVLEVLVYAVFWLMGLAVLFAAGARLREGLRHRVTAVQEQLRHQMLFREVWEQSLDGMVVIREDGILHSVNPAFCRFVGMRTKELEGRSLADIFDVGTVAAETRHLLSCLEGGHSYDQEIREFRLRDGKAIHAEVSDVVLRLPDRTPRVLTIYRDLAERRRAERALRESESRYRSLYQTSVAGIYRTNVEGMIIDCNDAFARMLGYKDAQELSGLNAVELYFTRSDRESFLERLRRERTILSSEIRLKMKDGTPLWALENVTLIDRDVILGTMIDISNWKTAEARLHHAEDQLRLDRLRMQIAADLHDDIGSTVSSTSIFNGRLRQIVPAGSEDVLALSARIEGNLKHIQEALHDIVWSVDPANDTIDNTLLRIQEYAADVLEYAGIIVTIQRDAVEEGIAIPMQRRRLIFLLMKEAITNVVRHAGCTAAALTIATRDGRLHISLADNGRGFDPAAIRGNGVPNMRRRADECGGELTVVSLPGHGTTITLDVPLA